MKTKSYLPFIGHPSELGHILADKNLKASLEAIATSENPDLKHHKDAIVASRALSKAANDAANKGMYVGELVSLGDGALAIARLIYARFATHVREAGCSAKLGEPRCSKADEHRRFDIEAARFKGDVDNIITLAHKIIEDADTVMRRHVRKSISKEHLKKITSHDGILESWFQKLRLIDSQNLNLRKALILDAGVGCPSLTPAILGASRLVSCSAPSILPTSNEPAETQPDDVDEKEETASITTTPSVSSTSSPVLPEIRERPKSAPPDAQTDLLTEGVENLKLRDEMEPDPVAPVLTDSPSKPTETLLETPAKDRSDSEPLIVNTQPNITVEEPEDSAPITPTETSPRPSFSPSSGKDVAPPLGTFDRQLVVESDDDLMDGPDVATSMTSPKSATSPKRSETQDTITPERQRARTPAELKAVRSKIARKKRESRSSASSPGESDSGISASGSNYRPASRMSQQSRGSHHSRVSQRSRGSQPYSRQQSPRLSPPPEPHWHQHPQSPPRSPYANSDISLGSKRSCTQADSRSRTPSEDIPMDPGSRVINFSGAQINGAFNDFSIVDLRSPRDRDDQQPLAKKKRSQHQPR